MRSFKDYFIVLDEIRKSRGYSVADLCEGIISERTYYRHMISNNNIRFDCFNQLASRLNVQPYEIIQYSTFVRGGDPGITRFMYRVHVHHYDDIQEIYQSVLSIPEGKDGLSLLLKVYIKKYELSIGKINKTEYQETLNNVEEVMRNFVLPNVYVYTFRTLYLLEFKDNSVVTLKETVDLLTNADPGVGVLFLNFAFDNIFRVILDNNTIGVDEYHKLFEKMGNVVQFFPHKFFHTRYVLYSCYGSKIQGSNDDVYTNLNRHLLGNVLLLGKEDFERELETSKKIFDIDPLDYLRKRTKEFMLENLVIE